MRPEVALSAAVLVPLVAATLCVLVRRATRAIAFAGALGLALAAVGALAAVRAAGGPVVVAVGGWDPPLGIALVADGVSCLLLAATGAIGVAVLGARLGGPSAATEDALALLLLAGVAGGLLTGDLFNLYVWTEVTLVASWGLLALRGGRIRLEAALRYGAANILASLLLLGGIALLFGITGTLDFDALAERLASNGRDPLAHAVAAWLAVALAVKAALLPLSRWLTASYAAPSPALIALVAALVTKLAAYALLRVGGVAFAADIGWAQPALLAASAATAVGGALLAAAERDLRRLLASLLVSHMGFIAMGVTLFSPAGLQAAVLYMLQEALAIAALFLLAEATARWAGTLDLARLSGRAAQAPAIAALAAAPALSLAGIPPLPGFWGEVALVRACLAADPPALGAALAAALLLAALLGLYAMFRAISRLLLAPAQAPAPPPAPRRRAVPLAAGQLLLALALLAIPPLLGPILSFLEPPTRAPLAHPSRTGAR